jgi:signal transduction histidine kinase/DNA-binding response OmpR family regulator
MSLRCILFLAFIWFAAPPAHGDNPLSSSIPSLSISDTLNGGGFRMGRVAPWRYSFTAPDSIHDGISLRSELTALFDPSVKLRQLPGWNGYIWMELTFDVDSTLSDRGFLMRYFDHGGAKFWLNGRFIGQSGNPSPTPEDEVLGPFINPDYFTLALRNGTNHLLVEYSEHTLPLWLQRAQWGTSNIIFFSSTFWLDMRRERAFVFGGALMLLTLLILLNAFLWVRFQMDFHRYVLLTSSFLLLHAVSFLIDTLFSLSQRYILYFEAVNAVGFLFALVFFLFATRSYFNLPLHAKSLYLFLAASACGLLSMIFVGRSYLEEAQFALIVVIILFGAVSFWQARGNSEGKRIFPVAMGLIVTLIGATFYVFVYGVFMYRDIWLLLLVTFLAYTSIPVSLTFTTIIDYANLFRELETKVAQRTHELEESLRYRTKFFENVSHEYRTPLTIAQGLLARIIQTHPQDSPMVHKLIPVKRNVDRLTTMVEQVLALSSLDNRGVRMDVEHLAADDVVSICVESFRSLAELKHQEMVYLPNAPDAVIAVDRPKMESVVNNILSNAIKYNGKQGLVVIRTQTEEDRYLISIEDNGPGIDPSESERIFERFHRIRQNDTEYVEGVGIGLELSRTYARAMDGDVVLDTQHTRGARFVITMPVAAQTLVTESIDSDIDPMRDPEISGSTRILVVEDNDDMGFYLNEVLSEMGRVDRVSNGKAAIEWLQTSSCELIITDLMMPEMDGERLIDALSQHPQWKEIPIVVLSAKSLEEDRLRLLRFGVVDFISKPFHADELYLRIKNLLEFANNRKQLQPQEPIDETTDRISEKVANIISMNIADSGLSIDRIASELTISRRTLYRQIEAETGMSLAVFIREIRLHKARYLAGKANQLTLKELASQVGYLDANNFRKLYMERFGTHPLDDRSI